MKKVSELTGAELDCWVAKAEGYAARIEEDIDFPATCYVNKEFRYFHWSEFSPSSEWGYGGPVIEGNGISTFKTGHAGDHAWFASVGYPTKHVPQFHGPTPLIAAMRAYVSSKYGEEVPEVAL